MKIQIDKTYPMPCTPEVAWEFLQNLEAVAGCMPGAKITERLDPGRYKGTVTARVGPATMSFRGEVEMKDVDPAARSLRLLGKGTDSTGSSGAALSLTARIESAEGGLCTLVGTSEVSMSGKVAAFGGRMMNAVADQILQQFAQNFAAQVSTLQARRVAAGSDASASAARVVVGSGVPAPADPVAVGSGASASAARVAVGSGMPVPADPVAVGSGASGPAEPVAVGSDEPASAEAVPVGTGAPAPAEPVAVGSGPPAPAEPVAPVAATELNVLALAWTLFRNWLRRLFSRSAV